MSEAELTLTGSGITRAAGSTVNFTNTGGTLGQIGSNPNIFFTLAPTLNNSLLGGAYTVNATDFASYNATYGVGALSATGFAGYSPLLINNAVATDNVSMGGGTGVNLMNTAQNSLGQTINSLRITATTAIGFGTSGTVTSTNALTLASGGLLTTGALTLGSSTNNGALTSGGVELFLTGSATSIINSTITSYGMAVVKSGSGAYTLNGTNTYTGGTYVDQGTVTLGNAGNVTVGQSTLGTGGIFLHGGTLTQTAGSVIYSPAGGYYGTASAQSATIAGNGALNTSSSLAYASSVTTPSARTSSRSPARTASPSDSS